MRSKLMNCQGVIEWTVKIAEGITPRVSFQAKDPDIQQKCLFLQLQVQSLRVQNE